MDKNIRIRFDGDADQLIRELKRLAREVDGTEKHVKTLGDRFEQLGKVGRKLMPLSIALTAVGAASLKLSVDAGETRSKFVTVFGDMTDAMDEFVGSVEEVIPATREEMQAMLASMQDLLVPLGMMPDQAAEMSSSFVSLAADLASFNNIPVTQALEAIRSGLIGQSEPLRQFGIMVQVADIEAKALEMGLMELKGELTSTARSMALFEIATEQSSFAIGDAARTAESAANQFKFLFRDIKELATQIGEHLVPAASDLVAKIRPLVQAFGDWSEASQKLTVNIGAVTAALPPLLVVLAALTVAVRTLKAQWIAFSALTRGLALALGTVGAAVFSLQAIWKGMTDSMTSAARQAELVDAAYKKALQSMSSKQLGAELKKTREEIDKNSASLQQLRENLETLAQANRESGLGEWFSTFLSRGQLAGTEQAIDKLIAQNEKLTAQWEHIVELMGEANTEASKATGPATMGPSPGIEPSAPPRGIRQSGFWMGVPGQSAFINMAPNVMQGFGVGTPAGDAFEREGPDWVEITRDIQFFGSQVLEFADLFVNIKPRIKSGLHSLMSAFQGAAGGFAMGGPIGAVIGALPGLVNAAKSLFTDTETDDFIQSLTDMRTAIYMLNNDLERLSRGASEMGDELFSKMAMLAGLVLGPAFGRGREEMPQMFKEGDKGWLAMLKGTGQFFLQEAEDLEQLRDMLGKMGIKFHELEIAAKAFGLTAMELVTVLVTGEGDFNRANTELYLLIEAVDAWVLEMQKANDVVREISHTWGDLSNIPPGWNPTPIDRPELLLPGAEPEEGEVRSFIHNLQISTTQAGELISVNRTIEHNTRQTAQGVGDLVTLFSGGQLASTVSEQVAADMVTGAPGGF